jgi:hypothetical protein
LLTPLRVGGIRKRRDPGGLGQLIGSFLALDVALGRGHAELDRLGKRGGIGVRLGGLKQLLGRGRLVRVAPITNLDGGLVPKPR